MDYERAAPLLGDFLKAVGSLSFSFFLFFFTLYSNQTRFIVSFFSPLLEKYVATPSELMGM